MKVYRTILRITNNGAYDTSVEGFEVPCRNTAGYLEMQYGGYLHAWKMDGPISDVVKLKIMDFRGSILGDGLTLNREYI